MRLLHRLLIAVTGVGVGAVLVLAATAPGPQVALNVITDPSSWPVGFTTVGDSVFFVTSPRGEARVLWRTDGTTAGTVRVADVRDVRYPTAFRGGLVFAQDEEIRMVDGSAPDTHFVAAIRVAEYYLGASPLAVVGDALYVLGCDPTWNCGLWRSDGSPDGTVLLAALDSDIMSREIEMASAGGTLFFNPGTQFETGGELWRSDGTVAGTQRVAAVDGWTADGFEAAPRNLTGVGSLLFFVACDAEWYGECRLWRTDGTAEGAVPLTVLTESLYGDDDEEDVPDFHLGAVETVSGQPLLFAIAGRGVWSSDGSVEGTRRLADTDCYDDECGRPTTAVDGHLIVAGCLPGAGCGLLRTDGTPGGTALIAASPGAFHPLGTANGIALFTRHLDELWRSDGTPAGTHPVTTLPSPLDDEDFPWRPDTAFAGGTLVFQGCSGSTRCEPWRTDGTAAGTRMLLDIVTLPRPGAYLVEDINPLRVGSEPRELTAMNDALYFAAFSSSTCCDENHLVPTDNELWRSDGTEVGTVQVADIAPGPDSSHPRRLTVVNGVLFFRACDAAAGCELWRSDGTPSGTRRVADIAPGPGDGLPYGHGPFTVLNGALVFPGCEPATGCEPWISDGSAAGTFRIMDVNPGVADGAYESYDGWLAANGRVYFTGDDPTAGRELWSTDGRVAGTVREADVNAGPAGSHPDDLTSVAGTIFFRAGQSIWRIDGSEAGATAVAFGLYLTAVDDILYFRGATGLERTDASATETITVGSLGGAIPWRDVNGQLIAGAIVLWTTDGTAAGTMPLLPDGLRAEHLSADGDTLYVVVRDQSDTLALWRSDGTAAGTCWIADLPELAECWLDSHDASLVPANGRLFFPASCEDIFEEVWAFDLRAATTCGPRPPAPSSSSSVPPASSTTTSTATSTSATTSTPTSSTAPHASSTTSSTTSTTLRPPCRLEELPAGIRRRVERTRRLLHARSLRGKTRAVDRLRRTTERWLVRQRGIAPDCRPEIRRVLDAAVVGTAQSRR